MKPKNSPIKGDLFARAVKLLSIRPRSEHELRRRLSQSFKYTAPSKEILDATINRLKSAHLLDDKQFAEFVVHSRKSHHPKGKLGIVAELKAYGVDPSIIEEVLHSDYSKDEEYEKAVAFLSKKLPLYKGKHAIRLRQTFISMLLRRGFSTELTRRAIDEVLKKAYNISK